MKKIIYLHQYFKFPNENGGTRSFDFSKEFIKNGFNIEIISLTSDIKYKTKKRWCKIEKENIIVNYIYLPYHNKLSSFKRILIFIQFIYFSTLKILTIKSDLVIATSTPLTIGIPAIIKKFFHRTPYIFEVRDVWPEAVIAIGAIKNKFIIKSLYFLEKKIYQHSKEIIVLSKDMKKSITHRYSEFKSKTHIIENISEINRFQNKINPNINLLESLIGFKPRFSILYAGTFGKVNGINYLINLASETIKIYPSIIFILIGEGAEKNEIIELAKNKNVFNKNVYILDSISKDQLPQLYYECQIGSSFVINIKELWANSANKFFDTLAAGKPILINYLGWQSDVIKKYDVGYILPFEINFNSTEEFIKYTIDYKRIEIQNKNSINLAYEKYNLNTLAKKYIQIINKAI